LKKPQQQKQQLLQVVKQSQATKIKKSSSNC
jgi:hypothetical protein